MTAVAEKNWSYREYLALDDDKRYEIIDGELLLTPAPNINYQFVSSSLFFAVQRHVSEHKLGYVFSAPTDVILDPHNVVQPDILFVSHANRGLLKPRGVFGAPDLVMEIVSPGSQYRDMMAKKTLYERAGVKEYWLVNPLMKAIDVLTLNDAGYGLHGEFCLEDEGEVFADSVLLPGLRVGLHEIFAESF
jgi:Uma2 family endonuclease